MEILGFMGTLLLTCYITVGIGLFFTAVVENLFETKKEFIAGVFLLLPLLLLYRYYKNLK